MQFEELSKHHNSYTYTLSSQRNSGRGSLFTGPRPGGPPLIKMTGVLVVPFRRVWMGGYKCQLSVKISAICQLSVIF